MASENQQSSFDVARTLEDTLRGFVYLVWRIVRTCTAFLFRPARMAEHVVGYDSEKVRADLPEYSRPLTFVVVSLLASLFLGYFIGLFLRLIFQQPGFPFELPEPFPTIISFVNSLELVKLVMLTFPIVVSLALYAGTSSLVARLFGYSARFDLHLSIVSYWFGTLVLLWLFTGLAMAFYNDDPVRNSMQRIGQILPPIVASCIVVLAGLAVYRYVQLLRACVTKSWRGALAVAITTAGAWFSGFTLLAVFLYGLAVSGAYRL